MLIHPRQVRSDMKRVLHSYNVHTAAGGFIAQSMYDNHVTMQLTVAIATCKDPVV